MSAFAPYAGIIISQQEPGTVIRHPDTGEEMVVTDEIAVNMGHTVYVTPKVYEALKALPHYPERSAQQ